MRTDPKKIGPRRATPNFGAAIRGESVASVTNPKSAEGFQTLPCEFTDAIAVHKPRMGTLV